MHAASPESARRERTPCRSTLGADATRADASVGAGCRFDDVAEDGRRLLGACAAWSPGTTRSTSLRRVVRAAGVVQGDDRLAQCGGVAGVEGCVRTGGTCRRPRTTTTSRGADQGLRCGSRSTPAPMWSRQKGDALVAEAMPTPASYDVESLLGRAGARPSGHLVALLPPLRSQSARQSPRPARGFRRDETGSSIYGANRYTSGSYANICSYAMGRAESREGSAVAGRRRRDGRAHLRCAGGDGDQLPRGAGAVGAEPRARRPLRLRLHDQSVSRMHACLCFLLRSKDSHLSRLRRRAGLRAGDRGQGQRAGAAAGGAGAAELEAGAGRAGDQHRPLPVGREPLPDDARDPRGAGGGRHAGLGADQVAAGDARRRHLRADGEAACRSRSTSPSRPSTRRPGGRPSPTPPAPAPASTPSPSCAAAASTPAS